MPSHEGRTTGLLLVASHVSFVSFGQTRAPFLLQERDPVSPHTFELGAQGFEWR